VNPITLPWIAEIGIITYRSLTGVKINVSRASQQGSSKIGLGTTTINNGVKRPPLPSEILSTFIIFGAYSVIANGSGSRPTIGSLLGWGTVLATVMVMAGGPGPSPVSGASPGGAPAVTRSQAPNFMGPLPSG
jgi:hypothetical protein